MFGWSEVAENNVSLGVWRARVGSETDNLHKELFGEVFEEWHFAGVHAPLVAKDAEGVGANNLLEAAQ